MKRCLIISLLLISNIIAGQVDKKHYKIMSDDDHVGHLIASKRADGEHLKYEISSDVTIRILFKIQMTNEIQAVFKDGILIYSSATLFMNGRVYSDTKIEKANGYYTVSKDGHETKIYTNAIRSSSAKLYFVEPVGEEVSLSETEGELKDLDIQGVQKYALTADGSDRSVSTYFYSTTNGLSRIHLVRPYVPELHIFRVNSLSDLNIE